MNTDLKRIKKVYGEKMAHLCRELFSTLLEHDGLLYELITSHFAPNKYLYDDIILNNLEENFKNYIYSLYDVEKQEIIVNKNPSELLSDAGYDLYECKSEEDIQSFKKYYAPWEELCTFKGNRLEKNYVFFAVKKNVEEIKRENFKKPTRQDEYGTSVISIQFTKGKVNTLSIKNRYNHSVNNPDATYSNNLDNIIEGLTNSFENFYNLKIDYNDKKFEIPGYVRAIDKKYYKYNYEIDNIYYCPNNIIIDNYKVNNDYVDGSKYILLDYFIIDLKTKKIFTYDKYIDDCFLDGITIEKNTIQKLNNGNRIITINDSIKIILDKTNKIIGYSNPNSKIIDDNFLFYNDTLSYLYLPNVKKIGDNFLGCNNSLLSIILPSVEVIADYFLSSNSVLEEAYMENLTKLGDCFLNNCVKLNKILIPKVIRIGDNFLSWNKELQSIYLPNIVYIGKDFMCNANKIKIISFDNLKIAGSGFFKYVELVDVIKLPSLKIVDRDFFKNVITVKSMNMPLLDKNNIYFLSNLKHCDSINIGNVSDIRKTSKIIKDYLLSKYSFNDSPKTLLLNKN